MLLVSLKQSWVVKVFLGFFLQVRTLLERFVILVLQIHLRDVQQMNVSLEFKVNVVGDEFLWSVSKVWQQTWNPVWTHCKAQ